jgi:hypothetical protein
VSEIYLLRERHLKPLRRGDVVLFAETMHRLNGTLDRGFPVAPPINTAVAMFTDDDLGISRTAIVE